jgi:hypothetical protein
VPGNHNRVRIDDSQEAFKRVNPTKRAIRRLINNRITGIKCRSVAASLKD